MIQHFSTKMHYCTWIFQIEWRYFVLSIPFNFPKHNLYLALGMKNGSRKQDFWLLVCLCGSVSLFWMLDKHNWIPSFCSCYKSVEQLCSYSTNLAWFQTIKLKENSLKKNTQKSSAYWSCMFHFKCFKSGFIYTFSDCKRANLSLVGSESSPISSPQREAKGADLVGTLTKKNQEQVVAWLL